MPNLVAYDICGVQPMTGPTGLIFAMKARYNDYPTETRLNNSEELYSMKQEVDIQVVQTQQAFPADNDPVGDPFDASSPETYKVTQVKLVCQQ